MRVDAGHLVQFRFVFCWLSSGLLSFLQYRSLIACPTLGGRPGCSALQLNMRTISEPHGSRADFGAEVSPSRRCKWMGVVVPNGVGIPNILSTHSYMI